MSTEQIKQLATDVNNVALASFQSGKEHIKKPLLARIVKLKEALEYIVEKMDCDAVLCVNNWKTGLFCGLEDMDITDRYDACMYGYNKALDRVEEWALCGIEEALEQLELDKELDGNQLTLDRTPNDAAKK